jgi:hypothetical protein
MLGISGLLNLLTWVEHRQQALASPHEEGGVPCPISHSTQSPPPNSKSASGLWADLPQVNRRQLLWLLSHLLERQLEPDLMSCKEDEDELDDSIE